MGIQHRVRGRGVSIKQILKEWVQKGQDVTQDRTFQPCRY